MILTKAQLLCRSRLVLSMSCIMQLAPIAALSTRTLYDENGVPHLCVDEEMRRRLETKLITKILDFKADKIA